MQALVDSLRELLTRDKKAALQIACSTLIPLIHEIGKKNDIKLLDNTNYRQHAMWQEVRALWPDVYLNPKRTGWDARSELSNLVDIEFKTSNDDRKQNRLKTSFMWDKQSEEVRRTQTLASDAFVLGRFESETLQVILVGRDKETLDYIRECMKVQQADFVKRWAANVAAGKRGGSDAIRLNYELLLKKEVAWDVWMKGAWHLNKKSSECKSILSL